MRPFPCPMLFSVAGSISVSVSLPTPVPASGSLFAVLPVPAPVSISVGRSRSRAATDSPQSGAPGTVRCGCPHGVPVARSSPWVRTPAAGTCQPPGAEDSG